MPELEKGAVLIMDNLPAHRVTGFRQEIEEAGARLLYPAGPVRLRKFALPERHVAPGNIAYWLVSSTGTECRLLAEAVE